MKKNITKDVVVQTALELTRDKLDLQGLRLREIARTLGCSHTNLYNYFSSYDELLWALHAALSQRFMNELSHRLAREHTAQQKLIAFFDMFAVFYLQNKGWFRLLWTEPFGGERPELDKDTTDAAFSALTGILTELWREWYGSAPDEGPMGVALHTVHCYIIGEVSNFISGRKWIDEESALREHMVRQAVHLCTLILREGVM